MLRSISSFVGRTLEAADGDIGEIRQFYFDSKEWMVRYFVAETSPWLDGRLVLISHASLRSHGGEGNSLPVNLTRKQVRESPGIDCEKPVSRQQEAQLVQYYGWPDYWATGPIYNRQIAAAESTIATAAGEEMNPHLRSTREVFGYAVTGSDGPAGKLTDFLVDDRSWKIPYLVVDADGFFVRETVLLPSRLVSGITWKESEVRVSLTADAVRGAPVYGRGRQVTREYEKIVNDYYNAREAGEKLPR